MKMMKQLCTLLLTVVFATSLSAQHMKNREVGDETKISNFKIKTANGITDYTVKVDTRWTDYVETADTNAQDRSRIEDAHNVISTIRINNDSDPAYDNLITMTYRSKKDDPIKVISSPTGFDIMVAGEKLRYDYIKQECYVPKGCPINVEVSNDSM